MKILAVNGSPKGSDGNTDILVQAFLSGAREAGAETETIYLKDMHIEYCQGCFACWIRTPGTCIHEDDMRGLLPRLRAADVFVVATPLYGNMVTGQMKTFLDRTLPLSHPAIEKIGDEYTHPARYEKDAYRTLLITNAGFPETHHFEGLKRTMEISTSGPRAELSGMICCAGGPMLQAPGMEEAARWYLDATIQAGREVASSGRIAQETQAVLDRPLVADAGRYADTVNGYWRSYGVEMPGDVTSSEPSSGTPMEPSPDTETVRDLVSRLPAALAPGEAGDLQAAIQFDVSGEEPGAYYVVIENGACAAYEGTHPSPRVTIHSPADVWLKVNRGELDGATAFMSGQFTATGDVSLLMRFAALFSGG